MRRLIIPLLLSLVVALHLEAQTKTYTYTLKSLQSHEGYIRSSAPNNSFNGSNSETFRVGGWGDTYASYLWFDVDQLPPTENISSVKIYLYNYYPFYITAGQFTPTPMTMRALAQKPSMESTWSSGFSVVSGSETPLTSPTGYGIWYAIDITPYVLHWKNGTWKNSGILLTPTYTSGNWNFFAGTDQSAYAGQQAPGNPPYISVTVKPDATGTYVLIP